VTAPSASGFRANIPRSPSTTARLPTDLTVGVPNIGNLDNWADLTVGQRTGFNEAFSQNPYFGVPDYQNPYSGDVAPANNGPVDLEDFLYNYT
jgi:hypothetical protein